MTDITNYGDSQDGGEWWECPKCGLRNTLTPAQVAQGEFLTDDSVVECVTSGCGTSQLVPRTGA
jgi:hypothetical protein